MSDLVAGWVERVRAAGAARSALRLRGGGTKDFYGGEPRGELLDTRAHAGIVNYEPTELVVTARCGTPLAELEAALAAQGQMLAFEPPHFGAQATVGGCIAAGLSGPRRASAGALRDYVLGVKLLDGKGDVLSFGGQVMKNVAGYDVSRLLAGSLGILGVILEVSVKVLPRPTSESTLRFELPQARAILTLNQWAATPLPISASAWRQGQLLLRLSGAEAAVRAAIERLGGDPLPDAEARKLWEGLREQTDPYFSGDTPLWRLSLPSKAASIEVEGEQLIEWGGALRWLRTSAAAGAVREAAHRAGGHATLFRAAEKSAGAFAPLPEVQRRLHRGLKTSFDPQGIFNPGRLYAEL
ncbi:MAG: glycolate oxidase subunit GlcE [Betaproteobacteria bacterium]|nr:glycolate oxidase subunit GlcE [Betaproteobacteria bacterium]